MIILPILITSRDTFLFKRLGECTFSTWTWEGESNHWFPTLVQVSLQNLLHGSITGVWVTHGEWNSQPDAQQNEALHDAE